jgi:hypothetical protein
MRLAICTALFVAAGASALAAQGRQIGAKAGPSFSMVVFDPDESDEDYDRRRGATGGGFAVVPITRRVGLQIEAMFSARGARLYDAQEELTGKVLLRYFDIPVLIRINGPRTASRAFHVFGGPYSGFRMSATREVSFVANSITSGSKMDMGDEVERFEFGLLGGAGLDLGEHIVIDGRYGRALTSLNTDRSDGVRIKNRMFAVMAGVRF